jgi:hypothetical protein
MMKMGCVVTSSKIIILSVIAVVTITVIVVPANTLNVVDIFDWCLFGHLYHYLQIHAKNRVVASTENSFLST